MQIQTAFLCLTPMLRHALIDIRLVYDLRDQLRPIVDQRRIGRRDLGRVDGVGRSIFDEEGEQREDGADQEDHYQSIYRQEYYEAFAHFGNVSVFQRVRERKGIAGAEMRSWGGLEGASNRQVV